MQRYYVDINGTITLIKGGTRFVYVLVPGEVVVYRYMLNGIVYASYNEFDIEVTLKEWGNFKLLEKKYKKEVE